MTITRHENGAGATPTHSRRQRRRRADQLRSAAASAKCRRRRRGGGGAQLYLGPQQKRPDAWTQTPISAWLASVPIVPVLRNDHWGYGYGKLIN